MASRRTAPEPRQARLTADHMRAAIPPLQKRIEELKAIDVSTINSRNDARLSATEQKLESTIADIFGTDTVEFHRYHCWMLDKAPLNMAYDIPIQEVRDGYAEGIAHAISTLTTIIELFVEKLGAGQESPESRARRAFGELELHQEISRRVTKLFEDGHYANAVEDACKVLNALVKLRSGRDDLDGTALMRTVFSAKNPVLRFNDLKDDSDRSEQEGMMHLYEGAMLALRNPRAHAIVTDDPEQAVEYIGFLSLLAKALDRTQSDQD